MVVGCTVSEDFEQIRETCNSLMIKLHKLKIVNNCMLLHTTGIKLYEELYRKFPELLQNFFVVILQLMLTLFSKHIN